jgi:hypothetical protein
MTKQRRKKAEVFELQEKVIRFLSMGMTHAEIAKNLDISIPYISDLFKAVKERRLQQSTEDYAQIICEGYDFTAKQALALYQEARDAGKIKEASGALKVYQDALSLKAKLFGANKPDKVSWTNMDGTDSGELKVKIEYEE